MGGSALEYVEEEVTFAGRDFTLRVSEDFAVLDITGER